MTDGPLLEALTRRLTETPPECLAEPRLGSAGEIHVAAVVNDALQALGGAPLSAAEAQVFTPEPAEAKQRRRFLRLVLVAAWLLRDPWFEAAGVAEGARAWLLGSELDELAQAVDAPRLVADADRREELARLCLRALRLRPAGETEAQAQDRWRTLSTAERQRVMAAARAAEQRAQDIREAMRRKAAEEAADKWTRE